MTACLCPMCSALPAPTYTPEHREACEVRYLLALPTREARVAYFEGDGTPDDRGVDGARGKAAGRALRAALKTAWEKQS